jgi:hypothetical protein
MADVLPPMSPLQMRAVERVAQGQTSRTVAAALGTTPNTVNGWVQMLGAGLSGAGSPRLRLIRAWYRSAGLPLPAWALLGSGTFAHAARSRAGSLQTRRVALHGVDRLLHDLFADCRGATHG